MSAPIKLLHAAPLRHVPTRARDARTSYAPVVTEVRLRELSRSEAPEGPAIPVTGNGVLRTRLVDGAAWRPIGCLDGFGERDRGPTAQKFASWLEGDESARDLDETDVTRCLEGTPVLARAPGQRAAIRPYGPWATARIGRISFDTGNVVQKGLADYVDANMALVGGVPFMRMPGPLAYRDPGMGHARILRHPGAWTSNSGVNKGTFFRADRMVHLLAFEGMRADLVPTNWDASLLAGLAMRDDDDLDLMVRDAVRIHAIPLVEWRGEPLYGPEQGERLARYSALGSVGLIPANERLEALEFIRTLLPGIETGPHGNKWWLADEARRIARYATEVALPRLEAANLMDPDDVESLSALGM